MRFVLAMGLVIAMCASAYKPRHFVVHPNQEEIVPPGWYKFPGYPPIPPEENRTLDPSNFGGPA